MADYGFATYDPRTQRIEGMVNSKYPIFGARYDKIKTSFRTVHINETYTQPFQTASLSQPPASAGQVTQNGFYAYEKTLIKRFEHKLGTTPLGYWIGVGTVTKNTRMSLEFSNLDDSHSLFPASFSATGTRSKTFSVSGAAGQAMLDSSGQSMTDEFKVNMMTIGTSGDVNIIVPNNYPLQLNDNLGYGGGYQEIPGDNSSQPDYYSGTAPARWPYIVEVDDKYVSIYRLTYWCDIWSRYYQDTYDQGVHVTWDEQARSKGAIDFAGSSVDITIYLCPYSMEDLL